MAERHADLTNMPPSPPSTVDNNDGERQEDEDHDMFILPPARSPSSADPSAHAQNEKRRRDQENIILADAEAAMIRCLPGSRLDKQEKKVTKIDRLQLLQTGCHRVERIKYALEQVYRENGGPPGIGRILDMFEI